jgi:hypothetical protein
MSANFSEEFANKLRNSAATVEDVVIANTKTGIANTLDLAESTGSDKFIKSAKGFEAGANELLKTADELVELLKKVAAQYDKLNAALN